MTQNKKVSWAATGPWVFRIVGEFSPQAANNIEDSSKPVMGISQRFVPRNKGILTSYSPKSMLDDGR
jgi:hypothetical protein